MYCAPIWQSCKSYKKNSRESRGRDRGSEGGIKVYCAPIWQSCKIYKKNSRESRGRDRGSEGGIKVYCAPIWQSCKSYKKNSRESRGRDRGSEGGIKCTVLKSGKSYKKNYLIHPCQLSLQTPSYHHHHHWYHSPIPPQFPLVLFLHLSRLPPPLPLAQLECKGAGLYILCIHSLLHSFCHSFDNCIGWSCNLFCRSIPCRVFCIFCCTAWSSQLNIHPGHS